jgi:hypothetical protein
MTTDVNLGQSLRMRGTIPPVRLTFTWRGASLSTETA